MEQISKGILRMMTTVTLKKKIKLTSVVQRVDWFTVG